MKVKRMIMMITALLFAAAGVSCLKLAAFGMDVYQVLLIGLDQLVPISYGTLNVILSACLLVFALVFDRHYIGFATAASLFFLGYLVEFILAGLRILFPDPTMAVRLICFVIGSLFICLQASMFITADLGVSAYDTLPLIVTQTWKKGKYKYVKIIMDVTTVVLGVVFFLLGSGAVKDVPALAGVGTVISAFCFGPLIDILVKKVTIPILYGKDVEILN